VTLEVIPLVAFLRKPRAAAPHGARAAAME
jgi:hypothetical protein